MVSLGFYLNILIFMHLEVKKKVAYIKCWLKYILICLKKQQIHTS